MLSPRTNQEAVLLNNGDVLIHGGQSQIPVGGVAKDEIYDVATNAFEPASPGVISDLGHLNSRTEPPAIAASFPVVDATDVPVDPLIAIRFNKPISIAQLNASTVTVVGPTGAISGRVVGAEGGRLAFFTPDSELRPGTTYTVFASRITDLGGVPMPLSTIRFSTHQFKADPASSTGNASRAGAGLLPSSRSKALSATNRAPSRSCWRQARKHG